MLDFVQPIRGPPAGWAPGRVMARVQLADELQGFQVPPGSVAQVAVYSDHWGAIAVVRRILLRMKSWVNYVV